MHFVVLLLRVFFFFASCLRQSTASVAVNELRYVNTQVGLVYSSFSFPSLIARLLTRAVDGHFPVGVGSGRGKSQYTAGPNAGTPKCVLALSVFGFSLCPAGTDPPETDRRGSGPRDQRRNSSPRGRRSLFRTGGPRRDGGRAVLTDRRLPQRTSPQRPAFSEPVREVRGGYAEDTCLVPPDG